MQYMFTCCTSKSPLARVIYELIEPTIDLATCAGKENDDAEEEETAERECDTRQLFFSN